MKAMIFAAGLGSRLAPLTNTKPKALVEINGVTMLELLITRLKYFGFNYIVINVHHFAEQIIDFVNSKDFGIQILISDESAKLLDTGGGLKNAQKFFNEDDVFLVHNVDIFSDIDLKDLFDFHINSENIATLAVKHRNSKANLLFDENDRLCGWKSNTSESEIISIKKSFYNEMAFSGIYVFNYKIFDLMQESAYPIIPKLLEIAKDNRIGAYIHDQNYLLDVGKPHNL